jgi:hypothetical protein
MVLNDSPDRGEVLRLDDYGDDGVAVEAFVFCHMCGARAAKFETTLFSAEDYDDALATAERLWEDRAGGEKAADAIKADARRYRRLLHEGMRFRIGGVTHESKAATDAAIDALPEPPPGSASRM